MIEIIALALGGVGCFFGLLAFLWSVGHELQHARGAIRWPFRGEVRK